RHVRLQLRPAVSGSRDGPAADLRSALLCRSGGGPLPLDLRSAGAALALAAGAAVPGEARGAPHPPLPPHAGPSSPLRRADAGPQGGGLVAGRARPFLRRLLRLVPLAQALAPLDAARPVLGVLPPERARRAHRGVSDELAGGDLLLEEHGPAGGP